MCARVCVGVCVSVCKRQNTEEVCKRQKTEEGKAVIADFEVAFDENLKCLIEPRS